MTACRRDGDDVLLQVHAQPGAKQTTFVGLHGEALKIRLSAPPLEGRANDELRRFLAEEFGVAQASVVLLSGENARQKRLRIIGATRSPAALQALGVL